MTCTTCGEELQLYQDHYCGFGSARCCAVCGTTEFRHYAYGHGYCPYHVPPGLHPVPGESLGTHEGAGFVHRADGCTIEAIVSQIYDHTDGDLIRTARTSKCPLSLGEAARRLGLKASQLSDLEWGRLVLPKDEAQALIRWFNAHKLEI